MVINSNLLNRFVAAVACLFLLASPGFAQEEEDERAKRDQTKTKQAQAVSKEVFESIQKAQELVDAQDYAGALKIIDRLYNPEKLTEYEQSNVLNYKGFIHYNMEDVVKAIQTYELMVKIPSLEPTLLKSTTYTLAQLYTVEEDYRNALAKLEAWFKLEDNPRPDPFILKAQNLYQLERYQEMIEPVETAISIAQERGLEVKEDWYAILNFGYFQMENYSKVRDIQKILLVNWPKKRYWFSLAGAYTELGEDRNLVNAYNAAFTQGMLEKESEFVTMAQLFMQAEVPYAAASLLEEKMDDGVVLQTEKNWRLLSQALMLAMEDQRAIPALTEAAKLSEDGELDIRLANTYLNLGEYGDCAKAARNGLRKGGLKSAENAQISLGMCLYNLKQYSDAKAAFREAGKARNLRRVANQWITVIDADVERNEQIRIAEENARKQLEEVRKRREESQRA